MKIKFPKDFSFGCAMSGPQTEGNQNMNKTNWDMYFEDDPNSFWDNIGPKLTTNTYKRFREDTNIARELKLNSLRTSIQWARLLNNPYTLEIDQRGVQFYREYFKSIKEKGITLIVSLSHFDMPKVLQENNEGFLQRETADLYGEYAKICFELFSEYVDYWTTFNEPYSYLSGCYLRGAMLPCEYNFQKFFDSFYNLLIGHSLAVNNFRKGNYKGKIGIVLDCMVPYPRDKNNKSDIKASHYADLIKNRSYLDPCIKGAIHSDFYNLLQLAECTLPEVEGDESIIIGGKVDFVGINYYRPERVKGVPYMKNPDVNFGPEHLYMEYIMPKARMNKHRGWEIYPKALYDLAIRMRDEYPEVPWYLSENGMGVEGEEKFMDEDGVVNDEYRIQYITEHLYWLQKAITEGSNCFGYHVWTFIDNWSWRNAYKNRYGLVGLDLKTRERRIKKSGMWFKDICETKLVDVSFLTEIE